MGKYMLNFGEHALDRNSIVRTVQSSRWDEDETYYYTRIIYVVGDQERELSVPGKMEAVLERIHNSNIEEVEDVTRIAARVNAEALNALREVTE